LQLNLAEAILKGKLRAQKDERQCRHANTPLRGTMASSEDVSYTTLFGAVHVPAAVKTLWKLYSASMMAASRGAPTCLIRRASAKQVQTGCWFGRVVLPISRERLND